MANVKTNKKTKDDDDLSGDKNFDQKSFKCPNKREILYRTHQNKQ
jgi:hypothetical protein